MTGELFAENILGADMTPKSILAASCVTSISTSLFPVIIAGLDIESRNMISVIGVSVRRANILLKSVRN
jgi:hypothetical protein